MKKMALVPHNLVERLLEGQREQQTLVSDTPVQYLTTLDQELKAILESKLPPELKAKQYTQVLQQYHAIRNNELHPKVEKIEEKSGESFLDGLHKTYLNKGRLLLSHLLNRPEFTWDAKNELSYQGTPILGSNVIDLIHAFVKPNAPHPVGWQDFARALRDTNAPRSAISNRNLYQAQVTPRQRQTTPPVSPATPNTPAAPLKRRRHQAGRGVWQAL